MIRVCRVTLEVITLHGGMQGRRLERGVRGLVSKTTFEMIVMIVTTAWQGASQNNVSHGQCVQLVIYFRHVLLNALIAPDLRGFVRTAVFNVRRIGVHHTSCTMHSLYVLKKCGA